MPFLVQHLWRYITQTACDGRELLLRRIEVFSAATWHDMRVRQFSRDHVRGTHMPKSAMTMSDDASLVRKRMFSGLSKCHTLHPKVSQENAIKTYLRSRWTMSLSC